MKPNVVVFASGRGSNFTALVQAAERGDLPVNITGLFCDQLQAPVIAKARSVGVPVAVFTPQLFPTKDAYEQAVVRFLETQGADWVVLAGYMRIVGGPLLQRYGGRIINIHPSLLPAFPGRDSIARAHEAGVERTGVTVHFVDEGVDTGPVIAQREVVIQQGWSLDTLAEKIHEVEHDLYPRVLAELVKEQAW